MADTKFSALTAVSAVAGANELPINEATLSKKVTATQIKTYVFTAPVFAAGTASANTAPKLTSGTLNTTAEAGALEFNAEAFYATPNTTAGRGVMPGWFLYRTTANGGNIGPTITDYFPATSSFPTVTNGIYLFNYWLYYQKSAPGTVTFTMTNTQTYTRISGFERNSVAGGITPVGTIRCMGISKVTTAGAAFPTGISLTDAVIHASHIQAIAECGTAGNIRLRATCSVDWIVPQRGSFYTVEQIPSANVGIAVA